MLLTAQIKTAGPIVVRLFLTLFFLLATSSAGLAQTAAGAPIIDSAKKEGAVTWYATMNLSDAQRIANGFERKYPPLKVNLYRSGSQPLLNRLTAEYATGNYLADVTETNILESSFFQKKGYFQPYHSPEAQFFAPQFRDPNGYWVADYLNFYIVAYNTRGAGAASSPSSYDQLLNPRWKNSIGMKDDAVRWYGALLEYMGQEKGKAFMRKLAAQDPRILKGSYGLISELIAAGELNAGIVLAATVETLKNEKKAPIDWENTIEPVATSIVGLYLCAKAPHPNAAKLFIDYFLSAETQKQLVTMNRVPARTDVKPKSAKLDPANLKIVVIGPEMAEKFDRYTREFQETFLSGR